MDNTKTGAFIRELRKEQNMAQSKGAGNIPGAPVFYCRSFFSFRMSWPKNSRI